MTSSVYPRPAKGHFRPVSTGHSLAHPLPEMVMTHCTFDAHPDHFPPLSKSAFTGLIRYLHGTPPRPCRLCSRSPFFNVDI